LVGHRPMVSTRKQINIFAKECDEVQSICPKVSVLKFFSPELPEK